MDLCPRHRIPLPRPEPWFPFLLACLKSGAKWLQSGDSGEGLLAWTGPRLTSRWAETGWVSHLNGTNLEPSPWLALEQALPGHPGPWIGAATYELCCDEADLPRKKLEVGQLGQCWMGVEQAFHWKEGNGEWLGWGPTPPHPEAWCSSLGLSNKINQQTPRRFAPLSLCPDWSPAVHHAAVVAIQEQILRGSFYVANLCMPFHGSLTEELESFALSALQRTGTPFGALLDLGDTALLSLSMERLLARRGDRIWSEPIKGSTSFTGDPAGDTRAAQAMAADPKEQAEHTMILDLVRNDLGCVARTGSVCVSRRMAVEAYPTVQHLVSTVEALAKPDLGLAELLRAVLPGGSVTGAPKRAVCQHLAQAEAAPRGFYCGALGWVSPNGDLDLALPIRTAQVVGDQLTYWTGGGITRRSAAEREWQELHLKTRALTA